MTKITTIRVSVRPEAKAEFADWQAKLNAAIASFPGFVSLEILSPHSGEDSWNIVERFYRRENASAWNASKERRLLIQELQKLTANSKIEESITDDSNIKNGVTEVFVTQVAPEKEKRYQEWIAKIHHAEAKFPGFRGVYMQSPMQNGGKNWITFLQFDTPENLDRWLNSSERQEVLKESHSLISAIESHRVISPFVGWFGSFARKGLMPPLWKQTMLILLVLFPIVMLEFKFLNPLTKGLNLSLVTFIGNAISVSLISWPMMPLAIRIFGWWLLPKAEHCQLANVVGTAVILLLYALSVYIFW